VLKILLVLAVVIRLALALTFGSQEQVIVDAIDYDRLAVGLVETGDYISEAGERTSLRPPLYPAMVAWIYRLCGMRNYVAVSLVQSAISLITVAVGWKMTYQLLGRKESEIAAVLLAFYPSLLAFNCLVLSETLFTLLFALCVILSVRFQSEPRLWVALLLGLMFGLGALTRSILWVCVPIVFAFLLITANGGFWRRAQYLGLASLMFALTLAPWAWRNTNLQHTFTLIDVMGGRNVMMGNYEFTPLERSWATVSDVTGEKAWHRVLAQTTPEYSSLTQGQIDKLAMRYGIRYFFANPFQSAQRCLVRFFNFWQLEREIVAGVHQGLWGDVSRWTQILLLLLIMGSYAAVLLSSIFGLFSNTMSWKQNLLLILWVALPCGVHTIAFAHSRYHLPLIPILCVYASYAMANCIGENSSRLKRAFWMAAPVALIVIAGWAREILMVDLAILQK
jgi:4-amino-4-deoxy-L-arabinose transferase-like glycosyltransferase